MNEKKVYIQGKTIFWYLLCVDFVVNPFVLAKEFRDEIRESSWRKTIFGKIFGLIHPRQVFQKKLIWHLRSYYFQTLFFNPYSPVVIIEKNNFTEKFSEYLKAELGLDPQIKYNTFEKCLLDDVLALVKNGCLEMKIKDAENRIELH